MEQRAAVNVKVHKLIRDWVDDVATKNRRQSMGLGMNKEVYDAAVVRFFRHDPPQFERWKLKSRDQLSLVQVSFETDKSLREKMEDLAKAEYRLEHESAHRSMAMVVEEAVMQYLVENLNPKLKHPERA